MDIRKYKPEDCKKTAELFYQTVHTVNSADYTQEQLDVWASEKIDLRRWNESFLHHYAVIAAENDIIVGFGDIDRTGYLDRLYVHKDYLRKGIAGAICDKLENSVNADCLTVHASITAKPFFEKRGYTVIKEQQVIKSDIPLTNYVMSKIISPTAL